MTNPTRCRGYLRIIEGIVHIGVTRLSDGATIYEDNTHVSRWAHMLDRAREEVGVHERMMRNGQSLKTWAQLMDEAAPL